MMRLLFPLLTFALLAVSTALACNIPVFRYALERWRPDSCEVVVFHQGGLSEDQESRLTRLVTPPSREGADESVKIVRCDLQTSSPYLETWKQLQVQAAQLPYVVVRTRVNQGRMVNAAQGSLEGENAVQLAAVFESPARTELSRRLLAGHAIVWLVIGSKNESQTIAASQVLEDGFAALVDKIQMPEGIGLPGSELHSEIPLLLKYSVLEIDRNDTKESFLVRLFAGFHPDVFAANEPLIVPVFGRGRALEVIPASDLTPRLLEDLTIFLSGACSCQVKEQNPGFDLLLSVDWDTELFGEGAEPPAERTTRDRETPELLTIPPGR